MPPHRALQVAVGIWIIYAFVIVTIVGVQPTRHTVTPEYQRASEHWWGAEKSLYSKKNGYLYLPQFAMLYSPFELLPERLGEPLWRLTCIALLAAALWMTASQIDKSKAQTIFLAATLFVLPSTFASARNGQVNLPLAGLFLFTALALARERWWVASVLLSLSLVLKPIAAAPILVCAALYPRLRIPLIVSVFVMAAVPFLHPKPAYVAGEYFAFFKNLNQAGTPTRENWCDFAGLLHFFGLSISPSVQIVVRALAGLATLWLCWRALRPASLKWHGHQCGAGVPPAFFKQNGSRDGHPTSKNCLNLGPFSSGRLREAILVMLLSVVYLMLFNPRTETNSYVMLAAFVAIFAAFDGVSLARLSSVAWLAVFAIILGSENYGWPVFPYTNLWLKALATCVFAGCLVLSILGRPGGYGLFVSPVPPSSES